MSGPCPALKDFRAKGIANLRLLGGRGDGSDETALFVDTLNSGAASVFVPSGRWGIFDRVVVPPGVGIFSESAEFATLDFCTDGNTDGLVWESGKGGYLRDITVESSKTTANSLKVRDLVNVTKYSGLRVRDCHVYRPGRFAVKVSAGKDLLFSDSDLHAWCIGESCLRVETQDFGTTTTRLNGCYLHYAMGHGADVGGNVDFSGCIVESNGVRYAHRTVQGQDPNVQDPLNGQGVRVRFGTVNVFGGHFENNAGHAIHMGSDEDPPGGVAMSRSGSILTPQFSKGLYTQPAAACVLSDRHLAGQVAFEANVWMPRSLVFTGRSRNISAHLSPGHAVPEYIVDGHPEKTIDNYPGSVSYTNPVNGQRKVIGN